MKRNPKQAGSVLWDCKPQTGPCPIGCNQCFYNRPDAFYIPIDQSIMPAVGLAGNGIVRMNCGHDSNIQRALVEKTASNYKHVFFNTSIPCLDFSGPVALTANPREEESYYSPADVNEDLSMLMFVRLRVSISNLGLVEEAVKAWTNVGIPVVLTFMAYYDHSALNTCIQRALKDERVKDKISSAYEYKTRHTNSYHCATKNFMKYVLERMIKTAKRRHLVTMCGTLDSNYCRDCGNCETYYWRVVKRKDDVHFLYVNYPDGSKKIQNLGTGETICLGPGEIWNSPDSWEQVGSSFKINKAEYIFVRRTGSTEEIQPLPKTVRYEPVPGKGYITVLEKNQGKHEEHNLCEACQRFKPHSMGNNCRTAALLHYVSLTEGARVVMWECPHFMGDPKKCEDPIVGEQ